MNIITYIFTKTYFLTRYKNIFKSCKYLLMPSLDCHYLYQVKCSDACTELHQLYYITSSKVRENLKLTRPKINKI